MISLSESKDAVKLCDLVTGSRKRQPVFYVENEDDSRLNNADTRQLLGGHLPVLKSKLRVNQEHLDEALDVLASEREPTPDRHAGVHKAFWKMRELKHELLSREMDIRSEKDQRFEINFPKKIDGFFGHMAVLGPTGSGKGWWITDLIKRMWQNTSFLQRRKVYYISAEATIDKTLDRLRIKKYQDWFFPIDVSYEAGEASGMSPADFWAEKVGGTLAEVRNAIVVLDDVQDSYGDTTSVISTQNRLLRIGRHRNLSVVSVFHSIKNGPWTRQLTQSARFLVLFAKAQQGRVRDFFFEALGMPRREALELTKHIQKCGRASIIRTSAPVTLICEKYLKLI
jgi:hypothetical protein